MVASAYAQHYTEPGLMRYNPAYWHQVNVDRICLFRIQ